MKTFIKFIKNSEVVGYALAYNVNTGWEFPILRLKNPYTIQDLKNADAINAETDEKLFTLDSLFCRKSDGFLELKGRVL